MSTGPEPPKHTNRLASSTSPYLLQHAHNPVDWFPWGAEALRKAQAEDKPILLSIGYSACHWCHVMERESFEDERIAALINQGFVPIKVDREERPDLDDIYMAATLAMNQGQGGWPMTVFLTPEQEPFFAGTYFPPEDGHGRPGFTTVLTRITALWRSDRPRLREQAAELAAHLRENARSAPGATLDEGALRAGLAQLAEDFDERFGGFSHAPKFPPAAALSFLLRAHRRFGDERALEMARKTLEEMARGGLFDQVGGGFHRYSVDERWLVPHFEKMLYDNAQLARVYLEAFQVTGEAFFRQVAVDVLDYVLREMTDAQGGFHSASDADSEGEEGKFFVWTPGQIEEVLGEEDARLFNAYYDVTARGNWEGHSIPNTSRSGPRLAKSLGLDADALERRVAALRRRVYEARLLREPPLRDDKVLTAWNGLMIGALAEGHRVLGESRYLDAAERAAAFALGTLARPDGRLRRTWRAGQAHLDAYLEDYAFLADALLDVYEAGGKERFLRDAERLAGLLREDFAAEDGGFYSTARGHEPLIVRHREGHDGAIPSANAVAARLLARLSFHLGQTSFRDEAVAALRAYGRAIARSPRAFTTSLSVMDLLLEGPAELAFVGTPGREDHDLLWRAAGARYLPNRIVAHHDPEAGASSRLPLLAGKTLVDGRAALYVCRDFACQRPVTDPAEVAGALEAAGAAGEAPRALSRALSGSATPEATGGYARRQGGAGYGPLGSTGLVCSRVGFGSYRVDDETPEHRDAQRDALRRGCNLVDTSTNYTDGGSERLVGETLAELARTGALAREEVVVVSKVGYVQGDNLRLAREKEASGEPFPEMVKYAEGVWHCVHPDFLRDQLSRSLARLGLETLDVCLLHNPEYYLTDAHERSYGPLEKRRHEFYRRLAESFAHLESEVARGRIRWFGVSSNTCTRSADDPEFTSLALMLEAARRAAGEGHHFRVLQLPLNVFEPGAALERSHGGETVLEHALRNGIGVLANRPLNALVHERMLRLATVVPPPPRVDLDEQLAVLRGLEDEYRRGIAGRLRAGEGSLAPEAFFRWGSELAGAASELRSLEHWRQVQAQRVMPILVSAMRALDEALTGPLAEEWHAWRGRYLPALHAAFEELSRRAALRSHEAATAVERLLDPRLPPERRGESLSRKALWVVTSTPGVSSALIGMRHPRYVEDALGILAWPRLEGAKEVYEALHAAELPAGIV
ncbi:MAG TPA: aldo/keto reductase [Vicinamibacteria bacterium]|nr:aldo/keto reductase [Vicinamibacteria bacterium]